MNIKKDRFENAFNSYYKNCLIFYIFLGLFFAIFFAIFIIFSKKCYSSKIFFFRNRIIKNNISETINITNIDYKDEFFMIKNVHHQINSKNLTYINTISCGNAKIGNALILLNKQINICENIGCKNIISPKSLQILIKRPIFNKEKKITIFPNKYKYKIKTDIYLSRKTLFWFNYKKKPHEMKLTIIRNEVLNNIPKFNCSQNDLIIHIRSGDIFKNNINRAYSQPPLCFYKKIIKENKFKNVYITSNGKGNPVIEELQKWRPKIKFVSNSLKEAISSILYAYNFIMSVSTFAMNLIIFNKNLINLYLYKIYDFNFRNLNCIINEMEPSENYIKLMKKKWKKTNKQLDSLLNENCINSKLISYKKNNSLINACH